MKTYSPTLRVALPGGNNRLRQLILYVAKKCEAEGKFGVVKLNKILWRADFGSYADRGVPVTGVEYRKLPLGPAPKDMPDTRTHMLARGEIRIENSIHGVDEKRTIALVDHDATVFSEDDLRYVNEAIDFYKGYSGNDASHDSHGIAWSSQTMGDLMPYQLSHLSDQALSAKQHKRLASLIDNEGMLSQ